MILDAFLSSLVGRGGSLRAEGDRLIFRGPPGSLAACDEEMLRDHKAELLERIRSAGPIEPSADEDLAAWLDDESLTVRTADVRASVEQHLAAKPTESPPDRPSDRKRRSAKRRPAMEGATRHG